ncbi:unnamed protein product [Vicia faba]|uniref:Uncharacterized protein n=1 Tax=Vicia faba TaxID=3906 RepID=A0AAV0ZU80_VICFA|nr:unnamed protein product [Vicia faba]
MITERLSPSHKWMSIKTKYFKSEHENVGCNFFSPLGFDRDILGLSSMNSLTWLRLNNGDYSGGSLGLHSWDCSCGSLGLDSCGTLGLYSDGSLDCLGAEGHDDLSCPERPHAEHFFGKPFLEKFDISFLFSSASLFLLFFASRVPF